MTILSYKTVFGPTFSAILENLLQSIFRSENSRFLGQNGHFMARLAKFGKLKIFLRKELCYLFSLIVPHLHAKFRENPWRRFQDRLCDIRTDKVKL